MNFEPTACDLSDFRGARPGSVRRDCIMGNMLLQADRGDSDDVLADLGFTPQEIGEHAECARIIAGRGGASWDA